MRYLSGDESIVIKETGKGEAVVTMNSSNFCREVFRQLCDGSCYSPISHDATEPILRMVRIMVENAQLIYRKSRH